LLPDVDVSDASRIPVFAREGAIIPLEVKNDVTGFGTAAADGALTLLVYPGGDAASFDVVRDDDSVELSVEADTGAGLASVSLGARERVVLVRVRVDALPAAVTVDGAIASNVADRAAFDAADEGFFVDGPYVWIKLPAGAASEIAIQ
jgi:alpha-D-xyloside xylohydrolase